MAYAKGPTFSIESSASLVPCNLSLHKTSSEKEDVLFGVIHKHVLSIGCLGSDKSSQTQVCYSKLDDKDPSCYLTQVRTTTIDQCYYHTRAVKRLGLSSWVIMVDKNFNF